MRMVLIWLAAAFVFANFYAMIAEKQSLLRHGQTAFLALQPVDPRSIMQGDYMDLNYAVMNRLNMDHFHEQEVHPASGAIIIHLDDRGIGAFVRYDEGQPLGPGEHRLKYHHGGWRAVIGAESYFIPEGTGPEFAQAAYGELKLEPDGTPLIIALCDKDLKRLGAAQR